MMKPWVDKCTICGREAEMRYQCRNCKKWSCDEVTCATLIKAESMCAVPKYRK
jgi:hypothetical protein